MNEQHPTFYVSDINVKHCQVTSKQALLFFSKMNKINFELLMSFTDIVK